MTDEQKPTWTVYDVACPFCGAKPGQPCANSLGRTMTASVHVERSELYTKTAPQERTALEILQDHAEQNSASWAERNTVIDTMKGQILEAVHDGLSQASYAGREIVPGGTRVEEHHAQSIEKMQDGSWVVVWSDGQHTARYVVSTSLVYYEGPTA